MGETVRMQILNIIFAAIIALLGLPAGLILAKIAKQELKPGKKYFFFMQDILLILAIIFVLYSYQLNLYLFLVLGLIITVIIIKTNLKPKLTYPILIILFLLSTENQNLLILTSSLIFLYGLPTAALSKIK